MVRSAIVSSSITSHNATSLNMSKCTNYGSFNPFYLIIRLLSLFSFLLGFRILLLGHSASDLT
jgi:hypothetical protein